MSRTTIRIELPSSSPDLLIKLLEDIKAQHTKRETATPGSSPLDDATIIALDEQVTSAKADRLKAQALTAEATALLEKSNKALGLAEGQTQRVEKTGLFYAAQTRDALLAAFRGQEHEMETFGFTVVVGSAASPVHKVKATS